MQSQTSYKGMFKIAFERLKSVFNTQEVCMKEKKNNKKSSHLVKKLKVLLRVSKA
jgi:hypothetical protein